MKKVDWVFWVQIEKREWFRYAWKWRGSNCLNLHFCGFHVSIGMPWVQSVIDYHIRDNSLHQIERTNEANREGVKTHGRFRFIKQKQ